MNVLLFSQSFSSCISQYTIILPVENLQSQKIIKQINHIIMRISQIISLLPLAFGVIVNATPIATRGVSHLICAFRLSIEIFLKL